MAAATTIEADRAIPAPAMAAAATAMTVRIATTAIPTAAPPTGIVAAGTRAVATAVAGILTVHGIPAAGSAHTADSTSASRGSAEVTIGPAEGPTTAGGIADHRPDRLPLGQM